MTLSYLWRAPEDLSPLNHPTLCFLFALQLVQEAFHTGSEPTSALCYFQCQRSPAGWYYVMSSKDACAGCCSPERLFRLVRAPRVARFS